MNLKTRSAFFFVPSLIHWTVPIVMLPVTTSRLDPEDYGKFAVISAITTVGVTLAALSSTYNLGNAIGRESPETVRSLVTAHLFIGVLLILLFGAALFFCMPHLATGMRGSRHLLGISLLSALFMFPWNVAGDLITLEGRARFFAGISIFQTLAAAGATVVMLFVFNLKTSVLFLADLIASLVYFGGSCFFLRKYLTASVGSKEVRRVIWSGFTMTWPNLAQNLQVYLERFWIRTVGGDHLVGIYEHSKRYKTIVNNAVSAVGRSVWPTALKEARAGDGQFRQTMKVWNSMYVLMTLAGMGFVLVGRYVIHYLTHGKFDEAYWLAAAWFIHLLLNYSQRAQVAVLFAKGHGSFYANSHLASLVACMLMTWFFVRSLGAVGAFLALLLQELAFRAAMYLFCRRKYGLKSFEGRAWFGIAMILSTIALFYWVSSFSLRLVGFLLLSGGVLLVNRDVLKSALRPLRNVNGPWTAKEEVSVQ